MEKKYSYIQENTMDNSPETESTTVNNTPGYSRREQ